MHDCHQLDNCCGSPHYLHAINRPFQGVWRKLEKRQWNSCSMHRSYHLREGFWRLSNNRQPLWRIYVLFLPTILQRERSQGNFRSRFQQFDHWRQLASVSLPDMGLELRHRAGYDRGLLHHGHGHQLDCFHFIHSYGQVWKEAYNQRWNWGLIYQENTHLVHKYRLDCAGSQFRFPWRQFLRVHPHIQR